MTAMIENQIRGLAVIDDFHPYPQALREHALHQIYEDWPGPDGEVYKRICRLEIPGIRHLVERVMGPVEMLGMAYRINHSQEKPNAAIHSDMGWGTHALVLYLSEGPSGTAFWRHRNTGTDYIAPGDVWLFEQICSDWNDESKWEQRQFVEMKMNRALIYESALFHSRYPFEAFGRDEVSGRLIVVAFFTPKYEVSNVSSS